MRVMPEAALRTGAREGFETALDQGFDGVRSMRADPTALPVNATLDPFRAASAAASE